MAGSRIRVEGLSDINRVLGQLPRATGKAALTRFGKKRLEPMRDTAKAKAPRAEGDLANSIIVGTRQGTPGQRRRKFADKSVVEVAMGPTADGYPQAVPQEFGSPNNAPVGYMRGAWDQHSGELLTNIAADLGAAVNASAKRHARKQARKKG